ncbi:MAG: hypothetical protein ACUVWJ_06440 [Spirochaetota bacterium]
MKTKAKIILNTLSISLLLLSSVLFVSYIVYTRDLKNNLIALHREMAKFILTLVDERVTALSMEWEAGGAGGPSPRGKDLSVSEIYGEILVSIVDYFDLERKAEILVLESKTGNPVYHTRRGGGAAKDLYSLSGEMIEGELTLDDSFGYFVRYGEPGITLFVFSPKAEAFQGRNILLFALGFVVLFFALLMLLLQSLPLRKWQRFVHELVVKLEDLFRGGRNVVNRLDEGMGGEIGNIVEQYNSMVGRVNSAFRASEERLGSLSRQRDNLKKLINLYKKYVPDEVLNKINESEVSEVVSRRLKVTSLQLEIEDFLKPSDLVSPEVITGELNSFHQYLKGFLREGGGIINFTRGYDLNIIYGIPTYDSNSFKSAVQGAKSILEWVERRNSSEENRSGVRWNVKMGLASGAAITGSVGESYIVIGEAIERALEMLVHAKYYNVPLVTDSADILASLPEIKSRVLDFVHGIHEDPTSARKIYELFLTGPQLIDHAIKIYTHGVKMFYEKKYDMAVVDFKKVNAIFEGDGPSQVFLHRCERIIRRSS